MVTVSPATVCSALAPPLPENRNLLHFGALYGCAPALAIAESARRYGGLVVLITDDTASALRLETELSFFLGHDPDCPVLHFPDWETLPYDVFSPHQDIIAQRVETLYRLPQLRRGILVVPVASLMQRIMPREFIEGTSLLLDVGDKVEVDAMRRRLEASGYRYVSQVMEHGEFTVRGSLIDLFPSGSPLPLRIDLFDDEVETIRTFDPDSQRTVTQVESVRLLSAREFPFTEDDISRFRQAYRMAFEGDPQRSLIYREVSQGNIPGGIEYYLPLFFEQTATLFDYLPETALYIHSDQCLEQGQRFYEEVGERYEQRRYDQERPILPPTQLYLDHGELESALARHARIAYQNFAFDELATRSDDFVNFGSNKPPLLLINARHENPAQALKTFLTGFGGRVLFAAESEGRREALLELFRGHDIQPEVVTDWRAFRDGDARVAITIAPLEDGLLLQEPELALIAESQLFGERVQQRRRRRAAGRDSDAIVRNLTELNEGAPVVHEDLGVGRYLGLQKLDVGGSEQEFLTIEYAGGDKLYVPVSSLHLISRYTGSAPENAPLHKLGTDQWAKARKRAAEKIRDVAAELLDIYARREASRGYRFKLGRDEYSSFAAAFPFEETPDQASTIDAVVTDMQDEKPMDRVVCGDVGFGKTEVAMRAAFVAVNDGKQVAVLVPTTLLAQQHYQNFCDRFADWPVRVEVLSRFSGSKQTEKTLKAIADGKVDIIVGTHKLLQQNVKFKNLGLFIIDEEQRFGVRQKETIKAAAANVDSLTLTATPIPRTLNMAMSGLRDLSVIATPPAQRLAVKTFVNQWDATLIKEACQREIKRGGQVYFLHNDVQSIERISREIAELVPEAKVDFAHGQMRERELERVMSDFYHRRFNVLVCTTIVESGIDIPTANTIIINRADKLGLAQLHQLRGRVGRSHHRAYCYLIVPPKGAMTADAVKRLEAIESLEDLGAGFMLAAHDLEIRGAGELLGDEQSGQIHEVGFSLYTELLERAVKALREGRQPELDRPLDHGAEVELNVPALIPDDYLPDVHARLTLYKRIASCQDAEELRELQVEMIDRFGLMPEPTKTLMRVTELKLKAQPLGIRKIEMGPRGGRLIFQPEPNIDPMAIIQLIQQQPKIFKLDGQDKLRMVRELEDGESRIQAADELLDLLLQSAA